MARHPSTKQLTSWLNGETDHDEHAEHIDTCTRCASRLEELSATSDVSNVSPLTDEFRPALMAVLRPPSDLHERISIRIGERLQAQSDAGLVASMLTVPVETSLVVTDE